MTWYNALAASSLARDPVERYAFGPHAAFARLCRNAHSTASFFPAGTISSQLVHTRE